MKTKAPEKFRTKKPLPILDGEVLPAGTEITLTDQWETLPYGGRGRFILEPQGERRLVKEEDLDYALGAH
jgi:hypothetical protein